jgi:hypothetical protein
MKIFNPSSPAYRTAKNPHCGQRAETTTVADIISARPLSQVWDALGGSPPKRGRARAFFRDGDNPFAVSLNDEKGVWFDHRDNIGGGVLDLIQRIRGCDRRAALRWLAELNGITLDDHPLTDTERREYARQRAEASELVAWKGQLVDALKRERERWWGIYHAALRYIVDNGLEAPLGDAAATLYEIAEERIEILNSQVDMLATAPFSSLLSIFHEQKGAAA